MLGGIVAVGIVFLLDSKPITTMACLYVFHVFDDEVTMRMSAEVILQPGLIIDLEDDGRPVTIEWYDGLSLEEQKQFLKFVMIGRWDAMTYAERQEQIRVMPLECHRCNERKPNMHVSSAVGYTRLICRYCILDLCSNVEDEY